MRPGPEECTGHWGRTAETFAERDSPRFATIRRATSRFGRFGWPFPSQDGPPEKKCHLESGLNQRDRAECKKRYVGSSAGARSKTATWGVRPRVDTAQETKRLFGNNKENERSDGVNGAFLFCFVFVCGGGSVAPLIGIRTITAEVETAAWPDGRD